MALKTARLRLLLALPLACGPAAGLAHTAASLADLSVHCYACNQYVEHPRLEPLLARLRHLKFGGGEGSGAGGGSSSKRALDVVEEED